MEQLGFDFRFGDLRIGDKVRILSKSVGINSIRFREGYVVRVNKRGDGSFHYPGVDMYYSVAMSNEFMGGDHYLAEDLKRI